MTEGNENNDFAASCSFCVRKFSYYKNLYVHMRRYHKDKPIPYKGRPTYRIICSICDEKLTLVKRYWDHIRSTHPEVQLTFEKKFFYTEEDFNVWRAETEARTHAHFVSGFVLTRSDGRVTQQFQCDRSGIYNPSPMASRKHISKKIGKTCPAYIYRTTTVEGDLMEIEVDFQSTHVGHVFDVHSLRVRSEKHQRRLRNKGKGRWPEKVKNPPVSVNEQNEHNIDVCGKFTKRKAKKKVRNLPPSVNVKNEHDVDLYVKSEKSNPENFESRLLIKNVHIVDNEDFDETNILNIKEITDILENDPDTEIQNIICTCKAYADDAKCSHIQTLLNFLNSRKSGKQDNNSDNESSRDADISCVDADIMPTIDEDCKNTVINDGIKSLEDEKASLLGEFQQIVNMCQNRKHLEILKEFVDESRKHMIFALKFEQ